MINNNNIHVYLKQLKLKFYNPIKSKSFRKDNKTSTDILTRCSSPPQGNNNTIAQESKVDYAGSMDVMCRHDLYNPFEAH